MKVIDTGVLVAAFAPWHEAHEPARRALAERPGVVAHSMLETYSVLTRLPLPYRAPGRAVADFLALAVRDDPLALSPASSHAFVVTRLEECAVAGGAVYDALIAETTRDAGGTLVTLDRRALATYARVGCAAELLT